MPPEGEVDGLTPYGFIGAVCMGISVWCLAGPGRGKDAALYLRVAWFHRTTGVVKGVSVSPDNDPSDSETPSDDEEDETEAPGSDAADAPSFTLAEPYDFDGESDSDIAPPTGVEETEGAVEQEEDDEYEETEYEDEEYRLEMAEAQAAEDDRHNAYVIEYLISYTARGKERTTWVRDYLIPPPKDAKAVEQEISGRTLGSEFQIRYARLFPSQVILERYGPASHVSDRSAVTAVVSGVVLFITGLVLAQL